MAANKSANLRRKFEFEGVPDRLRASRIETMIARSTECVLIWDKKSKLRRKCAAFRPDALRLSNLCDGCPRAPRKGFNGRQQRSGL